MWPEMGVPALKFLGSLLKWHPYDHIFPKWATKEFYLRVQVNVQELPDVDVLYLNFAKAFDKVPINDSLLDLKHIESSQVMYWDGSFVGYLGVVNVNVLWLRIWFIWCHQCYLVYLSHLFSGRQYDQTCLSTCKGLMMNYEMISQNIQLRQCIRPESVWDGEILYVLEYCRLITHYKSRSTRYLSCDQKSNCWCADRFFEMKLLILLTFFCCFVIIQSNPLHKHWKQVAI